MTNNADGATQSQSGARLTTLLRYMTAIDRGDGLTVAAVLRSAETDAALERMILAANGAYLEQDQPEPAPLAERQAAAPDAEAVRTAISEQEPPRLPPIARSQPVARPHRAVPRWAGALAAALVVATLLGSFYALFAGHGAPGSSGSPTISSTSTASREATVSPSSTSAANVGRVILVGTHDGAVLALRAGTGAVLWHWGGHRFVDQLVYSTEAIYVTWHAAPATKDNQTTRLTALRLSDGSQLWQTMEPQLQGYTYMALDGDALVVNSNYGDGTVYGLDARTGQTRWTYSNNVGVEDTLITATGGIAYIVGISHGFMAFDDRTGKALWAYDQGSGPVSINGTNGPSILAGTGGLVYYYLFDPVGQYAPDMPSIVTLDAATGRVRQTLTLGQTGLPLWVTPGGTAYAGKNNQLCALRIAGAVQLWCAPFIDAGSIDTGSNPSLRLVRASGVLFYSRLTNGDIEGSPVEVGAFDDTTGKVLWTWQGPGGLASASNSMSLIAGQSAVYLATNRGLYAFQPSTGHLLWHALPTTSLSFIQPALAP